MSKKKNILWLDDDEILNLIADQLFNTIADQIESFKFISSGPEALSHLQKCDHKNNFPDVLLVDLKMPEMDGIEFLTHYQSIFLSKYPQVQVYVLTSSIRSADMDQVKNFIFVKDYVIKPITKQKLKELLEL